LESSLAGSGINVDADLTANRLAEYVAPGAAVKFRRHPLSAASLCVPAAERRLATADRAKHQKTVQKRKVPIRSFEQPTPPLLKFYISFTVSVIGILSQILYSFGDRERHYSVETNNKLKRQRH
jgi:hypothetical protein